MSKSLVVLVLLAATGGARVVFAQDQVDATPQPPPPPPPMKPLVWAFGDFKLKLGGYVKVDLIHDFNQIGSTDSFDPRTIPVQNDPSLPSEGTRMHARQTRLNLDFSGPSTAGPFRIFVEGDFFGSGNSFRMRHAYGTTEFKEGTLLAGQTWTTFMDDAAMPETLDFESPIAFPQIRQTQARWTWTCKSGSYVAVSIEDPDSDVIPPTGVPGAEEEPMPDLNARLFWKNDRGHVQLGLFSGMARFNPQMGSDDNVYLWGLNLSTKMQTWDKDNAIVQITYGDGVGRYRGGITAAPDANGNLEAVAVLGLMGSYQHFWSDEFRSSAGYAWATADVPSGAPANTTDKLTYLFANLIWQFSDRAWTGIEYLHGSNDTTDHEHGGANRAQASIRFDF